MSAERKFYLSSKLGNRTSSISDGWNMSYWRSNLNHLSSQGLHVTNYPPHRYSIRIIRRTFDEVQQTAVVEPSSRHSVHVIVANPIQRIVNRNYGNIDDSFPCEMHPSRLPDL